MQQQALHQRLAPPPPTPLWEELGEGRGAPRLEDAPDKLCGDRGCQGDHAGFAMIGCVRAQDGWLSSDPALDHSLERCLY